MDFGWSGGFHVANVRLDGASLRVKIDEKGVSLGVLDKYLKSASGGGSGKPASIPDLSLSIHNTSALIETPLGALTATADAEGALRQSFIGKIDIAPRDVQGPGGGLKHWRRILRCAPLAGASARR